MEASDNYTGHYPFYVSPNLFRDLWRWNLKNMIHNFTPKIVVLFCRILKTIIYRMSMTSTMVEAKEFPDERESLHGRCSFTSPRHHQHRHYNHHHRQVAQRVRSGRCALPWTLPGAEER